MPPGPFIKHKYSCLLCSSGVHFFCIFFHLLVLWEKRMSGQLRVSTVMFFLCYFNLLKVLLQFIQELTECWKFLFRFVPSHSDVYQAFVRPTHDIHSNFWRRSSEHTDKNVELSTTGFSQKQNYSKESYTWCYRNLTDYAPTMQRIKQSFYWFLELLKHKK